MVNLKHLKILKLELLSSISLSSPTIPSISVFLTYRGPGVEGEPVCSVDLRLLGEREVGYEAGAWPHVLEAVHDLCVASRFLLKK